jgi:CRP-like cAMP-binding protein
MAIDSGVTGGSGRDLLRRLSVEDGASAPSEAWQLTVSERLTLASNSWFARLSSAVRHDLLRALRARTCEPGEDIFRRGEPARAWMVCLSGAVRIGIFSPSGRQPALRFIRAGHWFGDLPLPDAAVHTHNAAAQGPARIGEVESQAVAALMKKHPEFQAALLAWQSLRLASVFEVLEDRLTLGLPARLARQLLRLAKDHGVAQRSGEVRLALDFIQTDLADLVGCSRQRLNQEIRGFVRRGVVRYDNGTFIVADCAELQRLLSGFLSR